MEALFYEKRPADFFYRTMVCAATSAHYINETTTGIFADCAARTMPIASSG
jgi:hypothetical protein